MFRTGALVRRGGMARASAPESGGDWTPAELFTGGRVGAWYDYNDLTTMFQDMAGTIPVTAAGQVVGKVLDKSGNGFHWIANADDNSRPILRTDDQGNNYLEYDGVNDLLTFMDSIFGTSFTGLTAFGFRPVSGADGVMYVNRSDIGNPINPQFDISSGFYRYALRDDAGTLSIATSTTAPDTALNQILIGKRQAGVTSIVVDGTEEDTDSTALGAVAEYNGTFLGSFSGSLFKGGRYYPMVVVAGAVTEDEEAEILNWTATKASRVLNSEIMAIYTDLGAGGDFYDTLAPGAATVDMLGNITNLTGFRGVLNLLPNTGALLGPALNTGTGGLRFDTTGLEIVLDPSSAVGTLGSSIFALGRGIYDEGFFRFVIVAEDEPHDALIDLRIGTGGVRCIVQDAQANIAVIPGIDLPAAGEEFTWMIERTANGNAILTINDQSATVTKGAANGATVANTRAFETAAGTGYDFTLGRNLVLMFNGTLPTTEQKVVLSNFVSQA